MAHQNDLKRTLAKRYLELAKETEDAREREKFLGYATVYEQLFGASGSDDFSAPGHDPKRDPG